MAKDADRRRYPRLHAGFPVRYRVILAERPEFRQALVRDISAGGVRFRTFSFLPRGARMLLEMQFPDGPSVRAVGKAAWVRALAADGGYEVGGEFDLPSPASVPVLPGAGTLGSTPPGFSS